MKRNSKCVDNIELTSVTSDNDGDSSNDEKNLLTITKLRKILKPLIISMRCIGIIYGDVFNNGTRKAKKNSVVSFHNTGVISQEHFDKRSQSIDEEKAQNTVQISQQPTRHDSLGTNIKSKNDSHSTNWKRILGVCFCIYIISSLIVWSVLTFYIMITAKEVIAIMKRSIIFFWMCLCSCQVLVCLLTITYRSNSHPLSRFDKFVKAISLVRLDDTSKPTKVVKMAVLMAWMSAVSNSAVAWVAIFYPNSTIRLLSREVFFGSSNWAVANSDIIINIWSLIHVFANCCWIFPTTYYVLLSYLVASCFNDHFERVSTAILEAHKRKINLRIIRLEYVRLCHALTALNDLLSPLGMVAFGIYVPLICLNINVCIQTFDTDFVINKVAYIFWIVSNILLLLLTSVAGAYVNDSACQLTEVLYDIDINELDEKSQHELTLLVSHVTNNDNGVTVGGVVTITKDMIITVFGTIVGYLTILIQFK